MPDLYTPGLYAMHLQPRSRPPVYLELTRSSTCSDRRRRSMELTSNVETLGGVSASAGTVPPQSDITELDLEQNRAKSSS